MSQCAGYERYSFAHHKTTYACLECRTTTRSGAWIGHHAGTTCPKCGEKMVDLGPKQRVPKKRNLRAWAQLGIAYGVVE